MPRPWVRKVRVFCVVKEGLVSAAEKSLEQRLPAEPVVGRDVTENSG
jgi:hypothetical protein